MSEDQKRRSFAKKQKHTNTSKMPSQELNDSEIATQASIEIPVSDGGVAKKVRKPRQKRVGTTGSKMDVWTGKVDRTPGGLTKADLVWHEIKKVPVSKRKQEVGRKHYIQKREQNDENDPMRSFWEKKKKAPKSKDESPKPDSPKEVESVESM